ncbi:hypothetical protein Btru_065519 [Bulinus truncatus]|nr:hypothetical protein Btru_065519 [Bulinus truncatus]
MCHTQDRDAEEEKCQTKQYWYMDLMALTSDLLDSLKCLGSSITDLFLRASETLNSVRSSIYGLSFRSLGLIRLQQLFQVTNKYHKMIITIYSKRITNVDNGYQMLKERYLMNTEIEHRVLLDLRIDKSEQIILKVVYQTVYRAVYRTVYRAMYRTVYRAVYRTEYRAHNQSAHLIVTEIKMYFILFNW